MSQLKKAKITAIVKDLLKKSISEVAAKHNVSANIVAHIAKGNSYSDITGFIAGSYTLTDYRNTHKVAKAQAKIKVQAMKSSVKALTTKHSR